MNDSSPECIADCAERAMKASHLPVVSKNAAEFVGKEFSYEAAVNRYESIIEAITRDVP